MGKRALSADSFEALFSVFDRLKALVSELSDGAEGDVEIADVLEALDAILDAPAGVDATDKPAVEAECAGDSGVATSEAVGDAVGAVAASGTSFVSADAESLAQGEVFSDPELAAIFVETTVESLDELSHGLLQLEESPADAELLNTIFRCAHNIKGASGAAGLTGFNHLTHNMETVFDLLRSGQLTLDEGLTTAVFEVVDELRATIDGIKGGEIADIASEAVEGRFVKWIDGESAVVHDESEVTHSESSGEGSTEPATACGADVSGPDLADGELAITVDFPAGCDENAIQAFLICNKLSEFGELKSTTPDIDDVTGDAVLDTVLFILASESDPADLERILSAYGVDRVRVSQSGGVTEVASETTVPSEAATSSQEETVPTAPTPAQTPVALAVENVPQNPEAAASPPQAASSPTSAPKAATSPAPAPSAGKPPKAAAVKKPESAAVKTGETLRVDQERLDQLMNLGGELVINRARFAQIHGQFRSVFDGRNLGYLVEDMTERVSQVVETVSGLREADAENRSLEEMSSNLAHLTASFQQVRSLVGRVHDLRTSMFDFDEALHGLSRVSDGIQKGIMGTRMVAVGPLFTRFKRVVRDIAKSSGKKIDLVLKGEATELDKRMIDELGDPLTHMVRNSVDHGLELPEVRLAAGKPEVGTVTLEALHRGNSICIVVSDDGAGVNLERVRAKVLERELATQEQIDKMSDKELTQFIMKPGFSTAPQVTDLSGRGMGMDIVLSKIDKLNGSVDVDSAPGVGSKVTINLPLTLAILTSLVARVGRNVYAIPLETVAEIITVQRSDVQCIQRREVVRVRDRVIPIAVFEDLFGTKLDGLQTTSRGGDDLTLVIVGFESKKIGLIVDELLGQEDVVIKSISENYRNVYGIAGASIRGDGSVSLILDVNAMMDMAAKSETPQRTETKSKVSKECVPA